MAKSVLILMSNGFEDIEAVAPIDILTRCGVDVIISSIRSGPVKGAYGCTLVPHAELAEIQGSYDALIIPGGKANAISLAGDPRVSELIRNQSQSGRIVASICASPSHVLGEAANIVKGKRVTGDPAFNERLEKCGGIVTNEPVSRDGQLITAQGPGTALAFGFIIAMQLAEASHVRALAAKWNVLM